MKINTCPTCQGLRLNQIALSTKVADRNIMEICSLSIIDAYSFTKKIKLKGEKALIAEKLLKEINGRLGFMNNVGLGYLNLNRAAMSLSGGESQRIRSPPKSGQHFLEFFMFWMNQV